jgi:glutathione synthase
MSKGSVHVYPPVYDDKTLSYLVSSITEFCHGQGIVIRGKLPSPTDATSLAQAAPVTLFPTLFPRNTWKEALEVQTIYNLLYAKVSNDELWMKEILARYRER